MVTHIDPQAVSVELSPEATQHIKKQIQKTGQDVVLPSVQKTGCSGYGYATTLIEKPEPEHLAVIHNTDLTIVMTQNAVGLLNGMTIELEQKALGHTVLVYRNPNETGKCGCGESFTTDEKFSGTSK